MARSSQAKSSASRTSTMPFGSSASCIMIWDISTWSKKRCKPSTIPSPRDCHPCLRDNLLPMSPVWTETRWRRERDSNSRLQPWQEGHLWCQEVPGGNLFILQRYLEPVPGSSVKSQEEPLETVRSCFPRAPRIGQGEDTHKSLLVFSIKRFA